MHLMGIIHDEQAYNSVEHPRISWKLFTNAWIRMPNQLLLTEQENRPEAKVLLIILIFILLC